MQRSIGTWTSPTKRTINLTQLRRNKCAVKQCPGRKRPRLGDIDVVAAPDAEAPSDDSDDGDGTDGVAVDQQIKHNHLQQLTDDDHRAADARLATLAVDDKLVIVSCTMTKADLLTLDGDSWINDNVIHGYLALLTRSCADRIFIIPSFLTVCWQCANIDDSSWQYPKVKFSA